MFSKISRCPSAQYKPPSILPSSTVLSQFHRSVGQNAERGRLVEVRRAAASWGQTTPVVIWYTRAMSILASFAGDAEVLRAGDPTARPRLFRGDHHELRGYIYDIHHFFHESPRGVAKCHIRKVQDKSSLICHFAVVISAVHVVLRAVELVALLAPSSGASAAVARLGRSLIRSRRRSRISLAQPRAAISAQRDVTLSLNIGITLLTEVL